ncbi:hypothetical protein LEP1GSC058_1989 [Leptospira fainei serovar Hurstbridge str. BUT 6]|uniref:Uncharacterized protein n=1 Tax=Leptospira fainei serovar Hurstbridge str. BUT 6 TaxID=1193011 RepID=S3W4X6_9LEPT|nr:hypothetical protein LEP1GSC058_1989 [Leptospira fainei serovar Hurstbridge str. BUT 6]
MTDFDKKSIKLYRNEQPNSLFKSKNKPFGILKNEGLLFFNQLRVH